MATLAPTTSTRIALPPEPTARDPEVCLGGILNPPVIVEKITITQA